jgi:hypothetical protein
MEPQEPDQQTVFAEAINSLREEVAALNAKYRMQEAVICDMSEALAAFRALATSIAELPPVPGRGKIPTGPR